MRTVSETITTAERARALAPRHTAIAERRLLSFGAPTITPNGSLDLNRPVSIIAHPSNANVAYAVFAYSTGTQYLKVLTPSTASDWAMTSTSAATLETSGTMHALKSSLVNDSGTIYLYTAQMSSATVTVRRATITSTTNTPSVSLSTYATFGSLFSSSVTSSGVSRLEAVIGLLGGQAIIVYGIHDFNAKVSTLTFAWLQSPSKVVFLSTMLKFSFNESYVGGNFWQGATGSAFVCATRKSDGTIVIIANSGSYSEPRTIGFTVRNGVESPYIPVVPSDIESNAVNILPTGLTEINGLLYLSGRVTRRPATKSGNATAVSYDGYMISAGDLNFSFGARNHYIQSTAAYGTLFLPSGSTSIYYGGGQSITSAEANSTITGSTVNGLTLPITAWNLSSVASGAESLKVQATNALGALNSDTRIDAGCVVKLQSGQGVTLADMGEYGIDGNSFANSLTGRDKIEIETRDAGHKTLIDWVSPLYGQLLSRQSVKTNMGKLNGFTVQTPDNGYTVGTSSLTYTGLNEPFIAYASAYGTDQHLQKATVVFNNAEVGGINYHLSAFGFVFGATDDCKGNVFFIPKHNSWNPVSGILTTQPMFRKLNLVAVDPLDPNKENTGFNFTPRVNNLIAGNSNVYVRTSDPAASYHYRVTPNFVADTAYELAFRKVGRKTWVYGKAKNYAPASASANAGYSLLGEYVIFHTEYPQYAHRSSVGISLITDVPFSTSWFSQGAFNDIKVQATAANNLPPASYTRLLITGDSGSPAPSHTINRTSGAAANSLQAGMTVRVQRRSGGSANDLYTVASVSGSGINLYVYRTTTNATLYPDGSNFIHDIYVLPSDIGGFGNILSGNVTDNIVATNGTFSTPIETGARKRSLNSGYRAFVVTNDSTAGAVRYIDTDGVTHNTSSGATYIGGTYEAWDYPTSPTLQPRQWRVLGYGGRIYEDSMAGFGIPTGASDVRLLKVDDEAIRYELQQFLKAGVYPNDTPTMVSWTCVPAYYAPLQAANPGTLILKNWRSTGGQQPGDNFGDASATPEAGSIKNPAGLLAEIITRNNDQEAGGVEKAYHVSSATMIQSGSVTTTNTSYVTLDTAYPNSIRGADVSGSVVVDGDLAIISGRGQKVDGKYTNKTTHEADAPVVYLPTTGSPNYNQAAITVQNYSYFGGSYRSMQDAIDRVVKLSGMTKPAFRTIGRAIGQAITTTAYNVSLRENVSDFVLDLNAWIPSSNISTTSLDTNRLIISFRNNYAISIQGWNTSAMINNQCEGCLRIGLLLTNTAISADGNGDRWIEYAPVIVSDYNLSGSYSGSGTNWTLTADVSVKTNIRIVAIGSEIIVEIEGQPAWTFNLAAFNDGAGNNYAYYDKGGISIRYMSTVSATANLNVQELCDEATDVFINKGSTGADVLNDLIKDRHIVHRPTQNGGIEFSQFFARDDAGTLRYNILKDAWGYKDMSVFPHQEVIGESSGEYLDDTTARTRGYLFNTASNNSAKTGANAEIEARLLVRQAKEMSEQHVVSGFGFIEMQPEDKVTLVYSGATPATSGDFVVTSMSLNADTSSVKGEYTLRKYISSV